MNDARRAGGSVIISDAGKLKDSFFLLLINAKHGITHNVCAVHEVVIQLCLEDTLRYGMVAFC